MVLTYGVLAVNGRCAALVSALEELGEQVLGALAAVRGDHVVERLQPLLRLVAVEVLAVLGVPVESGLRLSHRSSRWGPLLERVVTTECSSLPRQRRADGASTRGRGRWYQGCRCRL